MPRSIVLTPAVRPVVVAALVGVSILGVAPGAFAVTGDIRCSGDQCDQGAWGSARGEWNQNGYWNMFAGHNCTNYVAWRLQSEGVPQPSVHLGNAATWAQRAEEAGILVDHEPEAGAVAQWDSYAGGNGWAGHVAYIEEVYDDGTMLVSEDYWHGGNQRGPLTYRTVQIDRVSNIIHFGGDSTPWKVRRASLGADGWQETTRRYELQPERLVAAQTDSGVPLVMATVGGHLYELADDDRSTMTDTGIVTQATSMAAISRGPMSYLMTVERNTLIMNLRTDDGWTQMPTGLDGIVGDIAVADEKTLAPTVLLSQAGRLSVVYLDTEGWHVFTTGLAVSGPLQAAIVDGALTVFSVTDGTVMRSWWDGYVWQQESTGILADSVAGVTVTESGVSVFTVTGERVSQLQPSDGGWQQTDLGLRVGTSITAAVTGSTATVIQVG